MKTTGRCSVDKYFELVFFLFKKIQVLSFCSAYNKKKSYKIEERKSIQGGWWWWRRDKRKKAETERNIEEIQGFL